MSLLWLLFQASLLAFLDEFSVFGGGFVIRDSSV